MNPPHPHPDLGLLVPVVTPTPHRGYALAPEDGVPGRDADVKCSSQSTGSSLALYRSVVDGAGPPLHEHRHEDETIFVLEGCMEVECGADSWRGGPGTTFFLPRGLRHTFRSVNGPAAILFLITPGGLDEFFRLRDQATSPSQVALLAQHFF